MADRPSDALVVLTVLDGVAETAPVLDIRVVAT
jgi:hypothetical protein